MLDLIQYVILNGAGNSAIIAIIWRKNAEVDAKPSYVFSVSQTYNIQHNKFVHQ